MTFRPFIFVPVFLVLFSLRAFGASTIEQANLLAQSGGLYAPASVLRVYDMAAGPHWDVPRLDALLDAIRNSATHGLTPDDYHRRQLIAADTDPVAREVYATDAYLTLAGHLLGGMVNPVTLEPTWTAKGRERDLATYFLEQKDSDIARSLEALAPAQPRYHRLREALIRYEIIAREGAWSQVPPGPAMKPGERSSRIASLRERLIASGDLVDLDGDPDFYNDALLQAVKTFQRRANLEPDGIVGPSTLRKLNLSAAERVQQIKVNLERWRWLPDDLGHRHIRVNIADYRLETHEGAEVTEIYDVVVGRPYRQTPVFSGSMSYLVLNPWWETPRKLARLDLLPKFQADPGIFTDMGYQILDTDGRPIDPGSVDWQSVSSSRFPYRVRQSPGAKNALGRVKFMFPNEHQVYLHDTPSRDLFSKTRRDFSSGCIRVNDPLDLAVWVLQGSPGWGRKKIEDIVESGKETTVRLAQKVPVHLLYWTVVVNDETGDIRFVEDIYDRDSRVWRAMQGE
ncbi:murein L,D-transpeptidase YcbB/YkuD [Litorivivens lipolytica]|uniref:Murein L,D-transpeptidase YcbB/YkuD n=1 Tax=Litorivivens lipolytica TaxID=1524264 RepID=A0A7W4Z617_9GAMM|nr:L,D-transpeptidase family protein [Litorivivens lipolytica]MBB3046471.1 murein L,D-transpeptidase YcbB/YkuD [Litorivivens lipolytica]